MQVVRQNEREAEYVCGFVEPSNKGIKMVSGGVW